MYYNATVIYLFIYLFILSAVLLLVFKDTGFYLWPSSFKIIIDGTVSQALRYNPPYSVYAANNITAFIILDST